MTRSRRYSDVSLYLTLDGFQANMNLKKVRITWMDYCHTFSVKKGSCHLDHRGSRFRVGPCGSPLETNWPLNCVTSSMLKGKRHLIDCSVTLALQDWKITEQHS